MIHFLSLVGTTILGSLLTWFVATVTRKRAEAKAERATVRAQADALIVAVSEIRAMAHTSKALWGSWQEIGRTFLLTFVAGAGGLARTAAVTSWDDRGKRLAFYAGLGAAADMIGLDRRETKRLDGALAPAMTRVIAAAAPLLRHPDSRVAEATEKLFAAVTEIEATEALDTALSEFGRAVVPATTAPPPWWRRLRSGRSRQAIGSAQRGRADS
ncbi:MULTISPECIES: hypothetical protein [Streptomyces]|uniref:Secreted protein n=1 Tax=Streptomyces hokutonensis TaxID=1306990 RepID=A0ABW6M891_9ACTN|nr:hypothetical protein OG504_39295 [Streptomyces sp. NBC_00986]